MRTQIGHGLIIEQEDAGEQQRQRTIRVAVADTAFGLYEDRRVDGRDARRRLVQDEPGQVARPEGCPDGDVGAIAVAEEPGRRARRVDERGDVVELLLDHVDGAAPRAAASATTVDGIDLEAHRQARRHEVPGGVVVGAAVDEHHRWPVARSPGADERAVGGINDAVGAAHGRQRYTGRLLQLASSREATGNGLDRGLKMTNRRAHPWATSRKSAPPRSTTSTSPSASWPKATMLRPVSSNGSGDWMDA